LSEDAASREVTIGGLGEFSILERVTVFVTPVRNNETC
jgi:hypothetical protein